MTRISVAPMMDVTDRHFRWIMRRITRRTVLYTEMITTGAILHGDRASFLRYHPDEHPLALQLGGDDPTALARCASIAEDLGYDEINLNCGCPSSRVQRGCFGVSLMGRPERVAEAVAAMKAAVRVPVTVKHRIGFDDVDRYEDMLSFVDIVAAAGCDAFIVHARKAWLEGLSPKDNREVPPLRYEDVWRLKVERPALTVEINGGIKTVDAVLDQVPHTDGVMIGRAAQDEPLLMGAVERALWGDAPEIDALGVAEATVPYVEAMEAEGEPGFYATRHLLPLMAGQPGARTWRRALSSGDRARAAETLRAAIEDWRCSRPVLASSEAGLSA